MKLEKSLCYINLSDDLVRFSIVHKELINELSKGFNKIYILNLQKLRIFHKHKFFSIEKNKKLLPKNFKIIDIKNSNDFLKFSKNKKLDIIMNELSKSIVDFKIFYLLKKVNAKLIMISTTSMWGTSIFIDIPLTKIFVGYQHVLKKGFYYIWRFLTIINLFPKIHLLFESNAENIKVFNTGFSKKFENIFPFFKVSLYRKIIHINSKLFDTFYQNRKKKKIKNKKKFILFIDSPMEATDRTSREGLVSSKTKEKYYENLFFALNKISLTFKSKVIVSLHPDMLKSFNQISKYFKNNRNIVVSKKRTVDLIGNSSIVVFCFSSAVLNAVMLNKKIIGLRSKYFGRYNLSVHEKNVKGINCPFIDIDGEVNISKKEINKQFKKSMASYADLIKRRFVSKSNKPSFVEVVETLRNQKI